MILLDSVQHSSRPIKKGSPATSLARSMEIAPKLWADARGKSRKTTRAFCPCTDLDTDEKATTRGRGVIVCAPPGMALHDLCGPGAKEERTRTAGAKPVAPIPRRPGPR